MSDTPISDKYKISPAPTFHVMYGDFIPYEIVTILERELNHTKADAKEVYNRLKNSTERADQLESELAEMKTNVEIWKTQVDEAIRQVAASDSLFRKSQAELSELKRQIKDGEMVPVEVADEWDEYKEANRFIQTFTNLKQFAAEKAKELKL